MDMTKRLNELSLPRNPESYWMHSTPKTDYPILEEDITVDAVIVGGGMTGITSAYLLGREGLKTAIIEADRIVQGTSAHTTAKITSQHSLIYHKIKKKMGIEMAEQYANANESAISVIEDIIVENNINCDFQKEPAYIFTWSDDYIQKIADEADTASSLGINASYLESIPLPFEVKCALRFDNQARFHPRKYLLSLAKIFSDTGGLIYEKTRAIDIADGSTLRVVTEHGRVVNTKYVIVSSHFPFYDGGGLYFTRLYPERSYGLGVRIKGSYPGGMYITAEDPGRSIRFQSDDRGELLVFSGEHHKTGQGGNTMAHYDELKKFAAETFDVQSIDYRWSTQDYTSADEVPYTGPITQGKPNIFVASGFRKWGMTNSTASAMILRDIIVKGESPWQTVYNPSRFTPSASAGNLISENLNVAGQLISGKLAPVPGGADVKMGEGKVVGIEGQRCGAYRDEKDVLHIIDTTCTHMGCEIQWNEAEKTWDCPCHGSRFTYEGDIVEGPALKPLKPQGKDMNE